MFKKAGTSLSFLGFLFFLVSFSPAAEAPKPEIVSRTAAGEVVLRSLRPNGGVADYLPYVEDEVLVRFKDTASPSRKSSAHGRVKAHSIRNLKAVSNLERVKLPKGMSVERAVRSYRGDPDVLYAEPNYLIEILGVPNDPSFPSQWNLRNTGQNGSTLGADIKAVQAWGITTGSREVVVAVIDTGISLAAAVWLLAGAIVVSSRGDSE